MAKKKVLIVEDEEPLRRAMHDKLDKEGYKVLEAVDGIAGLELVMKEDPDIILLDIIMPKMDGFAMLKELKKDSNTKSIPVLMLTNLGQDQDIELGKELGAADFLIKANWKIADIITKIKKYTEK